jgi:transposase
MAIWLIEEGSFEGLKPYFPKSRGKPRGDNQLVLSGIAYVLRNGLMWKDAPREYGP